MRPGPGVVLAALAALALTGAPALAAPPRPVDLRVVGGGEWSPEPDFELRWTNQPVGGGAQLTDAHCRVRDPFGTTIAEVEVDSAAEGSIAGIRVPSQPGAYTAEVWLEDATGAEGPAATATLLFDNRRPAAIPPPETPAWIGRTAFPVTVQLGPPLGPAPLSGIRGYAVAIDSSPIATALCSAEGLCGDVALPSGPDGTLKIGALPEGTSHLHAVTVSGSGMRSETSVHAPLRVDLTDPVTRLQGVPTGWVDHPVGLTATAADGGSGMEPVGNGIRPFTAIRIAGAPPAISLGASAEAVVIADGTHTVAHYARDAAGNVNDGGGANGVAHRPPATTVVRIDRGAPGIAFAGSQDPRDLELIRAHLLDPLSGPDGSRGWIGVRRVGSGDRFEPLPAIPSPAGELRARWDSERHPHGDYEFIATGFDIAGNRATTTRRANGRAMVLPSPLKATTALRATFARRAAIRTVPYGRGVRLSGKLTSAAGSPLAGMPVRIVESFARGSSAATRVSAARTGPDGAFAIRLAPGASREVEAGFAGSPTLSRSAGTPLGLRVRSRVRLRASAATAAVGGAPLVFRGRVAAAAGGIPPGGKAVQLQFRLRGLPWAEFRTVQTDSRGRFRYAYRFNDDDSRGARFQFRAYAPAQEDWPYEPGGSQPVIVRGR